MNLIQQDTDRLKVIDAEFSVETGHKVPQPVVHLFCRDEDRNYRKIDVEGFRPYFYIEYEEFVERTSDVLNDRHVIAVEADLSEFESEVDVHDDGFDSPDDVARWLSQESSSTEVYHKPDTFTSIYNDQLVKVFTVEPSHVEKIRDHWDKTYEADIPFPRRFLIDSEIYTGVEVPSGKDRVRYENWDGHSTVDTQVCDITPSEAPDVDPRMLVVDIEVRTNGGGVPDPADSNNAITAITSYDNYTDTYAGWILESELWEMEYDDPIFESDVLDHFDVTLDYIKVFDHETQMVESFHEWVLDKNFDMATGWNSNNFDYPYIIQRSFNISAYSIRDWDENGEPYNIGDEWPRASIEGLVTFDMLDAYKKTQYRDLRSYKLDAVAEAELGMGKVDLEHDLDDAWHNVPVEFMRYNVRDVEAVVGIESQSSLIDLYDNMRSVTGALYNTCHHNGPMIDTLFLRQAFNEGYALTTNEEPDQGDYPGAKVFEPVPGIHENVVYPDLACFTPDTEVVTPDGVVSIQDLSVGDTVYSIDPETNTVTEKSVTDTQAYPEYDGELVDIQTDRADFSVTPNHKMVFESPQSGDAIKMEAGDIDEQSSLNFISDWNAETHGDGIDADTISRLCDEYDEESNAEKEIPEFVFTDASLEQKELLLDTLLDGDKHDGVYYTDNEQLADDVTRLCVEVGVKPMRRRRDQTTSDGTPEFEIRANRVEDGLDADEHVTTSEAEDGVYCVTVEDNHTLLAGRNGRFQWVGQSLYPYIIWTFNISPETQYLSKEAYREDGYTDDDVFTVYIDDRDWKVVSSGETIEPSEIDKDKYKGVHDETGSRKKKTSQGFDGIFEPLDEDHPKSKTEIYYLKPDVKEGFIRKTIDMLVDLKYQYKGQGDMYAAVKRVTNSVYGALGDSASGGIGFRLFDWKLAESITNIGRMVIEYTADEYIRLIDKYATEDGYDPETYLVAGDTDSVMSSIPQAPNYETALEWAERASEDVSGTQYDQFMEDEFNVIQGEDEHKMDVEIESLASKLFFIQDGDNEEKAVKKRYAQHIIWDEDDGWIDTDDDSPDSESSLRSMDSVTMQSYADGGLLSDQDPTSNIGIKGFEYVRSDSSTATKETQLQVLMNVLLADSPSDELNTYLGDLMDQINSGEYSVEKLGRPKGISNPLDEYGWKDLEELEEDTNYTVTEDDEDNGGRYVSTPGPTYRGAKYADDHLSWEDISEGSKPIRFYVEKVRGDDYPAAYEYESYPKDNRPDPLEIGRTVDAIAVDEPDKLPDEIVLDIDKMVEKELEDKIQPILRTIDEDWDDMTTEGKQSGLDSWM